MNRKIYRKIAKENGVTISEVKREMQAAINEAYKNPTTLASSVPRKGEIPTIDEFLKHSVNSLTTKK